MSWYRVRLSGEQIVGGAQRQLMQHFAFFFTEAGKPDDMMMFSGAMDRDGSVALYFSPATRKYADDFLQGVGAQACERPTSIDSLGLGTATAHERFLRGEV